MDLLQTGLAHHRAGRLSDASHCYTALLRLNPAHADALNLSGVLARQRGDLSVSERFIKKAIHQSPSVATYHHHLAKTHTHQGNTLEAIKGYERAISLNPADADSIELLAKLLLASGTKDEALKLYRQLLSLCPDRPDVYFNLGHLLEFDDDKDASLNIYREAARRFPDNPDAHFNLARKLKAEGQTQQAINSFENVLLLKPDDAETFNYLGTLFHLLGETDKAKESYLLAIKHKPDYPLALCNLGALLMDFGQWQVAEMMLRKAIELDPDLLAAYCNLGSVLAQQGNTVAAIEALRQVLQRDPAHAEALCTLGNTMNNLGDEAGAMKCFHLALKANPGHALTRFNMSTLTLAAGNFAEGWPDYELRWQVRESSRNERHLTQPRWTGEDLRGSSIFVYAEQGFGDTIQFSRYVLLLVELGAQVILEVQPQLFQLLENIHPSVLVITKDSPAASETNFHCPLLSLPSIFETDIESIPACIPNLHTEVGHMAWPEHLASKRLRVGVVWAGNPDHMRDRMRSIPFNQFSHILSASEIAFYSLQKGPAATQFATAQHVIDLDAILLDFTDTATAILNMDLVITVDTSVAHLAGALGKPVWILLHHTPDWRWLRGRVDTPWYPSARLFRQTEPGKWDDVLSEVERELDCHSRAWQSNTHTGIPLVEQLV
ncbi:Tetratricopeptide TPR_1 repeat-containing protein (plasmid) [Granulicella tundricola MP5ACTX9]|uniref:Tetratricopeptide TPR_1 repeat-containing protein n=2 Tax=Granulicella TaxID=940557 RepID=E8X5Z0_GRATM|nr:Tetratricopeptide TPR_1 repeat-containing protein [Granulicella tundricola MP5ACTX9]